MLRVLSGVVGIPLVVAAGFLPGYGRAILRLSSGLVKRNLSTRRSGARIAAARIDALQHEATCPANSGRACKNLSQLRF